MPLPFALNHINLWLLEDGDGWTIVDTGLSDETARETWYKVFDTQLGSGSPKRIICTHMHPDHIGLAGWLSRKFNIDLWMSRGEYLMGRTLVSDSDRVAPKVAVDFYRAAGFDDRALEAYKQLFGGFGKMVGHMPDSFRRLVDGQVITIGDHEWQVITGTGHSPEHVCLFCPELNILISGDQVLPRISSIVSVYPIEPHADPLTDWLNSCAKLRRLLPEDVLVLPAHNDPFIGVHTRLTSLIEGHERNLEKLIAALKEPKRAVDVFEVLFRRKVDSGNYLMATGESLAHLHCLLRRGQIDVNRDENGVNWYSAL